MHNYCVFVRLTYTNTIADLKDQITERDELRSIKNQLRKEIEETKIKEENNIKAIKDFDSKIPRQKAKLAEIQEKEAVLRNEIMRIEIESEKEDMKLAETKNDIITLGTMVVTDQEMESIVSAKEEIEQQLEEQDQITSAGRQKLKENSHCIDEALAVTTRMEALQSKFTSTDASSVKMKKKQVESLQLEVDALESSISQNSSEVEQLSCSLKFKEKNLTKLNKKLDETKQSYNEKGVEHKKLLKEQENLSRKLSTQEIELAKTHQQIRQDYETHFNLATNIIKLISDPIPKQGHFQN